MNLTKTLLSKKDKELFDYIQTKLNSFNLEPIINALCLSTNSSLEPIKTVYDIYQNQTLLLNVPIVFKRVTEYLIDKQSISSVLPLMVNYKNICNLINFSIYSNNPLLLDFLLNQKPNLKKEDWTVLFGKTLRQKNTLLFEVMDKAFFEISQLAPNLASDCINFIDYATEKNNCQYLPQIKKYFTANICQEMDLLKIFNLYIHNNSSYDSYFSFLSFFVEIANQEEKEDIICLFFELSTLDAEYQKEFREQLLIFSPHLNISIIQKAINVVSCQNTLNELSYLLSEKEKEQLDNQIIHKTIHEPRIKI
jgi:hypothetical protein